MSCSNVCCSIHALAQNLPNCIKHLFAYFRKKSQSDIICSTLVLIISLHIMC
jgi:hypothetical protein